MLLYYEVKPVKVIQVALESADKLSPACDKVPLPHLCIICMTTSHNSRVYI